MSISVVVCCLEAQGGLERCLDRLSSQTRLPDEVVVVVDESNSEAEGIITGWQESQSLGLDLRLEMVPSASVITSQSRGKNSASSSLVCFTRSDGLPDEQWLSRIESNFQEPLVGAVGGPVINVSDSVPRILYTDRWGRITWWGERTGNWEKMPRLRQEVQRLSGYNMAFRRYLLRDFDTNLIGNSPCEEDVCLALRQMGFKVISDPQVRVYRVCPPGATKVGQHPTLPSIAGAHHDNTYAFLKHSTVPQKVVFVPYTFTVGDRECPGPLRLLGRCLRTRELPTGGSDTRALGAKGPASTISELGASLGGKVKGLATYISYLRMRSKPYRY